MPSNLDRFSIQGSWTHSHEEDDGDSLVFRTSDFAFPPSRGRTTITLKSDGVAEVGYPGPDDRRKSTTGLWKLKGNLLEIKASDWAETLEIETLDSQVLVARRTQKEG